MQQLCLHSQQVRVTGDYKIYYCVQAEDYHTGTMGPDLPCMLPTLSFLNKVIHTVSAHPMPGHCPIVGVKIIEEMRCWELCNFPTPSYPHSHGAWDKSKNPYPLRNCITLNEATVGSLIGLVVPGPQRLPYWELCDFSMSKGSCYNPITLQ